MLPALCKISLYLSVFGIFSPIQSLFLRYPYDAFFSGNLKGKKNQGETRNFINIALLSLITIIRPCKTPYEIGICIDGNFDLFQSFGKYLSLFGFVP